MLVYLICSSLLALTYLALIRFYRKGWNELSYWDIPANFAPQTKISILIPARNEANNINNCLASILDQNYPISLFEILVIDDHSTDETASLVRQLRNPQIRLLNLADFVNIQDAVSFKKMAIELGIDHAKGELILTTDADCIVGPNWLCTIASFFESEQYRCIAAPVNFYQESSLLERFQSLDFLGMMLITGAGMKTGLMRMANGANLAYTKEAFEAVNGFQGINHLASGDDMLLVQKIASKYPQGVGFLKSREATVVTQAKSSWKGFIQQRIRWATKSTSYKEWQVTLVLALVFFFCSNILLSIILCIWWGWALLLIALLQIIIKAGADYLFLSQACHFFNRSDLMKHFWSAQVIHIFYIVGIGILGNFVKSYYWKGRKVK